MGKTETTGRAALKLRICLITRFSLVVEASVHSWRRLRNPIHPRNWFRKREISLEEKIAYLFAPARMEERFQRFEALLLPSIRAQTHAAEHIVLGSKLMPESYRARLEALSERFGFRLHCVGPERHVDRILTEDGLIAIPEDGRLATARIDDDDALATDFVRFVRRHARVDLDDYVISFTKGIYLDQRVAPNRYAPVVQPNLACGLTRVVRKRRKGLSIYGAGNHNHIHHALPVLQVPRPDMFLMTTHNDNISHRFFLRRLPGGLPVTGDVAERLNARFGTSLATE
ncbi:MAG: glycosyltransferase [Pseudomonadota bacterium]